MEKSPYTPGAGHTPPVLAGRDGLLRDWHLVLNDIVSGGRVRAQDIILAGPRGVGKTVTVSAFADLAKTQGFEVVNLQAVSGHAGLVEALLQRARTRMAEEAGPWQRARAAFERVGGVNLSIAGLGAGISTHQQDPATPGLDAGTLADALATLAAEVRKDAHSGGLLITVDELQVASAPRRPPTARGVEDMLRARLRAVLRALRLALVHRITARSQGRHQGSRFQSEPNVSLKTGLRWSTTSTRIASPQVRGGASPAARRIRRGASSGRGRKRGGW